jgi:hypothetical protein
MTTTAQKRAKLLERYPGSVKIKNMSDKQVHATYMRLLDKKELCESRKR